MTILRLLAVMMVIFVAVTTSYGYFADDFASSPAYTPTNPNDSNEFVSLVGKNGWVTPYDGGRAFPSAGLYPNRDYYFDYVLEPNDPGSYWFTTYAGAGRNVYLDVIDGVYEVRMAVHGQSADPAIPNNHSILSVGDSSLIQAGPLMSRNWHRIWIDNRESVQEVYVGTMTNGIINWYYPAGGQGIHFDLNSRIWIEIRITVNMNTGDASAWWRDLDDEYLEPLGSGAWTKWADFPGTIPYANLTAASFLMQGYCFWHTNFVSGTEDGGTAMPANCTEVVLAGLTNTSDYNKDCRVDFKDLENIVADWLRCVDPTISGCETPWQ